MELVYTKHTEISWSVYVKDTPQIQGHGIDKCTALSDLIDKYRAIISTVQRLQAEKECK